MNKEAITLKYNDIDNAIDVIVVAAERLKRTGIPLWKKEDLEKEELMTKYKEGTFISVFLGEELLGGLITSVKAPEYWPNSLSKGIAIYTYKLSITDKFIGNNYSQTIMEKIHQNAQQSRVQYARLDCDSTRDKLIKLYLSIGYTIIGHAITYERYPTNFFEKRLLHTVTHARC